MYRIAFSKGRIKNEFLLSHLNSNAQRMRKYMTPTIIKTHKIKFKTTVLAIIIDSGSISTGRTNSTERYIYSYITHTHAHTKILVLRHNVNQLYMGLHACYIT